MPVTEDWASRRLQRLNAGDVEQRTNRHLIGVRVNNDEAGFSHGNDFRVTNLIRLATREMNRERLKRTTLKHFANEFGVYGVTFERDQVTATKYITGADALHNWRDDVLSGKPPTFYPIGDGELRRIEIGPGLVTLIGGAPGAGKTAFTMQAVIDALRLTPTLRAVVCNIEMPPGVLLDRQLARLSGIDLTTIRYRRLREEHTERINAGLIVLDYIQRIQPPGEHGDKRGSVDATMSHLRAFADAGVAVVVLSAVGRTKDKAGKSSYSGEGLNLASFRESSELEFGADDAFILTPDDKAEGHVILEQFQNSCSVRRLEH